MDTLILKDCRFDCVIGVFPNERKTKQPVFIDAELSLDIRKAAKSDSMKDALDYRAVHALMKSHVEKSHCFLIESLAENLAQAILKRFLSVRSVTLTVKKPKPMQKRNGAWFGVKIMRSRKK